jgi:hypothetical protein
MGVDAARNALVALMALVRVAAVREEIEAALGNSATSREETSANG